MLIAEIRSRIGRLKEMLGRDDESAHSMEDDLHLDVLKAIAKGSKNAQKLAEAALKSSELGFSRHCA